MSFVVLSQWLALMHGVIHTPSAAVVVKAAAGQACDSIACELHELAAGHDSGSAACHLLDQLCHAMPGVDAHGFDLPHALAQRTITWPASHQPRLAWARPSARAPPVLD